MKKKTALVTGATGAIGAAIAERLAGEFGMTVLIGCRNKRKGLEMAQDLPGETIPLVFDVTDRNETQRVVKGWIDTEGPIDVLVNNAGYLASEGGLAVAADDFDRSVAVNLTAPFDLIRLVAPKMVEQGYGRIVNVSSGWGSFDSGLLGAPVAYGVTKAALNALTVTMARELGATVKVNACCPGWVRSRMGGSAAPRLPDEGADTPVWLATLPDDGPTGGFFRDRAPLGW